MKIVKRGLERKIRELVNFNAMLFGVTPRRETTDALFVKKCKRKELHMCFLDIEKAFDRVSRKVMEGVIRKKCFPEVIVRTVTSLYHKAKTKVEVGSEPCKNLEESWCTSRICVVPLLFAIAADEITNYAKEILMNKILYVNDLVLTVVDKLLFKGTEYRLQLPSEKSYLVAVSVTNFKK